MASTLGHMGVPLHWDASLLLRLSAHVIWGPRNWRTSVWSVFFFMQEGWQATGQSSRSQDQRKRIAARNARGHLFRVDQLLKKEVVTQMYKTILLTVGKTWSLRGYRWMALATCWHLLPAQGMKTSICCHGNTSKGRCSGTDLERFLEHYTWQALVARPALCVFDGGHKLVHRSRHTVSCGMRSGWPSLCFHSRFVTPRRTAVAVHRTGTAF